jgi:hypothetical protein
MRVGRISAHYGHHEMKQMCSSSDASCLDGTCTVISAIFVRSNHPCANEISIKSGYQTPVLQWTRAVVSGLIITFGLLWPY